ncbi:lipopolysaccharide biosynthesis protein [Neobacillus sp. K501]
MRLKKSIKNIMFSLIYYFVNVISTFVIRKVLIITIGIQGVGLNSLFNEVIMMLSLAEMGVGTAIIYSLYKPLAENNQQKVKELMNLFRKAYLTIAGIVIIIGLSLVPFIHLIVKETGYNDNYIKYIFILFVAQSAISYCFAYKRSLLIADQRTYISATVDAAFKLISVVSSISILWLSNRFDAFLYSLIFWSLLNNIWVARKTNTLYPYLKGNKEILPRKEKRKVFQNVKDLFISRVSGTVTNSTDNVLISVFVNTIEVGIYSNYALIINAFKQALVQFDIALQGSVGNLYAEGNTDQTINVLKKLTYIYFVLATVFCTSYISSGTSFVSAIFGDTYQLTMPVLLLTAVNLYFHAVRGPVWQVISVSGLFKQDKYIAILGTIVNLIVSVIMGWRYGVFGIFLGTTCTYIIQLCLKILLIFKFGFARSYIPFLQYWFGHFTGFLLISSVSYILASRIETGNYLLNFFLQGVIAFTFSLIAIIIFTFKTDEFKYFYSLFTKTFILKKKV